MTCSKNRTGRGIVEIMFVITFMVIISSFCLTMVEKATENKITECTAALSE